MADPHHVPELDGFDRFTVTLYRSGLWIAALGLLVAAGVRLAGISGVAGTLFFVELGVALAVANMHLYAKQIRWVIGLSCFTGLLLQVGSASLPAPAAHWVGWAGVGFIFVSLSALALKEQFCFKVPGLRAVPLLLAASLVPLTLQSAVPAGVLLGTAGGILTVLAVQKSRMPLHFDVGDKSKYQI